MSMTMREIDLEAARFKAAEMVQIGLRQLEFYAAAFSSTFDSNGDVIDPHAFDEWLVEFYAVGKPLPISFSHSAILESLDPTNVIGYAPADPQHVWVDGYGLRVSGFIDVSTEKGKAVEWQIENQLMGGASIAYEVPDGGRVAVKGGNKILKAFVREAGPTPNPGNQEAVLLWLKSENLLGGSTEFPYMTVAEFRETFTKTVDTSSWDGNQAMGMCSTTADYRSISAAEHTAGTPEERQHWALPHHYLGKGPNEAGVRAALSRVGQVQDITDAERASARNHLEAHLAEMKTDPEEPVTSEAQTQAAPEIKHAASPAYIQAAHDALSRAGAKCASGEETEVNSSAPPRDENAERLRRLRFMKTSIIR